MARFEEAIAEFRDATLLFEPIDDDLQRLCKRAYAQGVRDALRAVIELDQDVREQMCAQLCAAGGE